MWHWCREVTLGAFLGGSVLSFLAEGLLGLAALSSLVSRAEQCLGCLVGPLAVPEYAKGTALSCPTQHL